MKRMLALLICAALLFSMIPSVFAAKPVQSADLWQQIEALENRVADEQNVQSMNSRRIAYQDILEEVVELVLSSDEYVPGSFERHGDFFFWVDKSGDPNGYSPSLRAKLRQNEIPGAEAEDFAAIETVSYANGGWPSSMDIAAFQPFIGIDSSFTDQYERRCSYLAQATGGTGITYKTNQANINNIGLALSNCGVVIFDSHGDTDYDNGSYSNPDYTSRANTSYLCLTSGTGITAADKASAQGQFGTFYHAFNSGGYWYVDGTAMANHMTTDSPNGMLWMAICLGMATDGLQAPLRAKGVEVVYGYSQSVTFTGDYRYDNYFWPYMCEGHTVAESAAYMKAKANCNWDPAYSSYSYSQAVANHVAFPIVVSSEDPYPGHGNVDVVQVPQSIWTLFAQHTVNAVSNNPEWGTVSVKGTTVTASPNDGYYVDGYEIIEGVAEVVQNGNVFELNPESDCTIQINFAPRDPAMVTFSVPDGVSCDPIEAFVGDYITLPTPTGEPSAEGYAYKFLGWVSAAMDADSMTLPEFLNAGAQIKLSQTQITYYALYSYFVAQDGLDDNQFLRVDEAPGSWAGEYVITYDGAYGLGASAEYMSSTASNKLGSSKSVVDLAAKGLSYEDNILSGVTEDLVYVISPAENGTFTVKMKEANQYLALSADSDSLTTYTSSNSDKTRWTITMDANGPVLRNAEYSQRYLQYKDGSKYFRCYTANQKPITLFAKADGDTWYTTDPKDKALCEEHQFGEWTVDKEPSCTEAGQRSRLCTVCGYKQTETLEALGHDYIPVPADVVCEGPIYVTYVCSRCGDSYQEQTGEGSGHSFGDWTVATAPSCTEPGEETRSCVLCGEKETRTVEALGHDWNEGEITTQPSTLQTGVKTYTCLRCGETRTEELPKLDFLFDDVQDPSKYYYDAVYWAYNHDPQITKGSSDTMFSPNDDCTRAQVVTFLWRAAGCPTPTITEHSFTDVKEGSFYYQAVLWAVENGITSGTSKSAFSPDEACTRAHVVTFLWRAMNQPEPNAVSHNFTDVKPGSFYEKAVLWAVENGITTGTSNTSFEPEKICSRGQVVTFLMRAFVPAE